MGTASGDGCSDHCECDQCDLRHQHTSVCGAGQPGQVADERACLREPGDGHGREAGSREAGDPSCEGSQRIDPLGDGAAHIRCEQDDG